MLKSNRLLVLFLLGVFVVSLANYASGTRTMRGGEPIVAGLLPAVLANPVDLASVDTLRAGETLSQLLLRANLAQGEADMLLSNLREFHDPRRMRAGSIIAVRRSVEDGSLRRMDLRLDRDRTFSLRREGDGWSAGIEEVPVTPDTVVLSGTVETSLYDALVGDDGTDLPLEERLRVVDLIADHIFAWQVDFSRDLRTGDRFRLLYERMVRPDGTARSGRVLGVQFTINRRDYQAYAFASAEGVEDYYDANGESLRRAFLRAPLEYRRISSAFSRSRFHPVLRVSRAHNGIDYAASSGTPVRAVADGVVRRAGNAGSYGNLVEIGHARGYSTRYAHLRGFASGIRAGVRVKQGDVIGYVGATGLATGPHLHYEFHANGRAIDPNSVPNVSGDPVPESLRAEFLATLHERVALLDRSSDKVLLADASTQISPLAGD